MTDPIIYIQAQADDEGKRLDQFLSEKLLLSRNQVEKRLSQGSVLIEGAPPARGKKTTVVEGMQVAFTPPPLEPMDLSPEPMALSVLYEDEALVAIDKPAGLVVHPGEGNHRGTLLAGVLHHVGKLPDTDPIRPGVVHRLDRGTTGVILFAKSQLSHERLCEMFKQRAIEKTYLAVTQGVPKPKEGTFDTLFGRHPRNRQLFSSKVQQGKQAVTHYETLETYPGAASIQVQLETGRTHQIRVHFSDTGHPLVGDEAYARRRVIRDPEVKLLCDQFPRPALHAWELRFQHPLTHRKMTLTAPMPADMVSLVESLRNLSTLRETV